MPSNAKLQSEYDRILKTEFWQLYVDEIRAAYKVVNSNLATGRIETPTVMGKLWQFQKAFLEKIFNLPSKILRSAEVSRTPVVDEPE